MAVVEFEHGANCIRRDPAVVLNQPFDPLLPVRKKIPRAEPRPLDDGLAAPLSGHGLDQGAFGPINVFHDRSLTRSRPGVPAATELVDRGGQSWTSIQLRTERCQCSENQRAVADEGEVKFRRRFVQCGATGAPIG